MNRLAQLNDTQRRLVGSGLLAAGVLAIAVGVVWAHYALFPETVLVAGETLPVEVDYFGWIPRGWLSVTLGQLVATGGSQFALLGALMLWVIGKPMTWARAGFAAFIAWIELVLVFGVIPSEWLNLTQGPLGFTTQKIFVTIPPWLVLGNDVSISLSAVKDAVSGGYNTVMLAVAIVFAYKIQGFGKPAGKAEQAPATSPYGRPLLKVEK